MPGYSGNIPQYGAAPYNYSVDAPRDRITQALIGGNLLSAPHQFPPQQLLSPERSTAALGALGLPGAPQMPQPVATGMMAPGGAGAGIDPVNPLQQQQQQLQPQPRY